MRDILSSYLSISLPICLSVLMVGLVGCTNRPTSNNSTAYASPSAQIAHGRYIVEHVSMCADCHTPRDKQGRPIKGQELAGADLGVRPIHPIPHWSDHAPRLAGNSHLTLAGLTTLLSTGALSSGKKLDPPMPQFTMTRQDAHAAAMYIKSLKPDDD